jgi:TolB-like protein/Flp pilus assembly protein TadD
MLARAASGAVDAMSAEQDRESGLSQTSRPAGAVFLSYASEDAAVAERIAVTLRSAGIEVWFDKSELRGGDSWDRKIREQIHDCRLFIPVISANSESRDEGYFRREWSLAADRTRDMAHKRAFLLPVVIDGTPERGASVPEKFHELQWTRLPGGQTPPEFVERLSRLLSPETPPARAATKISPASATVQPSTKSLGLPWRTKAGLWATGAVLAVTLGYFMVGKFWVSKHFTTTQPGTLAVQETAPRTAAPATEAAFASIPHSIAVLPFVDLSEKQDQAYLADGMAEQVIDLLAKLPGIKVIGRTSSFQFRGKQVDARSIGTTLGVAHLLEGSVRRSANEVRVTAQLLNTRDGAHEWSDSYDATFDDVLKVQDAITTSLARALEVAVGDTQIPVTRSVSPAAYELFLKGMYALDPFTQEGCEAAIGLFTQSLQHDPNFAPAEVGIAWAYDHIGQNGWMPTAVAYQRARASATRALEIDPKMGAAHTALASIHLVFDWDWAAAQREIDTAFALGGRNSAGLTVAGRVASATDPASERAASVLHEAIALDPLNAEAHIVLGYWVYARTGRFAEAERSIRRGLQISPKWATGHYFLTIPLIMLGRLDDALEEAKKETAEDGQFELLAEIYHAQHRKNDSDTALAKAITQNGNNWASAIALVYAVRGESDKALQWLDRAHAQHDESLYFIKDDPQLRSLEADPRYKAFLRKMNLAE